MSHSTTVIDGMIYFIEKFLADLRKDAEFWQWLHAFYIDRFCGLMSEFECELVLAAAQPKEQAWDRAWAAFHKFQKQMGELRNEFKPGHAGNEIERFLEELRRQYGAEQAAKESAENEAEEARLGQSPLFESFGTGGSK